MKLIEFNPDKITPEEIDDYYHRAEKFIYIAFDKALNPDYEIDFLGLTSSEIELKRKKLLDEEIELNGFKEELYEVENKIEILKKLLCLNCVYFANCSIENQKLQLEWLPAKEMQGA